jgi:flagellar motor switch protein FliM
MAEILSQSQIDELLKNLSSGEAPMDEDDSKKRVKDYDFRSPKRFTREQLKIIDSIYQNFSRRLASYLSGILRVYCEAEVLQIEEQKYYEYSNALADSVLIGNFNINYPEDEKIEDQLLLMELSKTVSFSIIDRMLGGSGEGYNYMRDYTEIELTILENLLNQMGPMLRAPWASYFVIEPTLRKIETNARLGQSMNADETVLIIVINIKMQHIEGLMNICMSGASLAELLKAMDEREVREPRRDQANELGAKSILQSVEEGALELTAVLGEAHIHFADILHLRVGDVIELDKSVSSPIVLMEGKKPWFYGALGVRKQRKAVKILDYYEKRGKL